MKKINFLLGIVLAAAVGLFGLYLFVIHKQLDTTPPVITLSEQMLEVSVRDPESVLMEGIVAMDAKDGDVTDSLIVESIYGILDDNVTTVTYAAFDRAGNVSKIQRKIRYMDYESPRFTLEHSMCFPAGSGFNLLEYVGAMDVLEADIGRRVRATLVSDTKTINEVGSHIVRLQVTNALGDTVEIDLPVEVYDPEWYSASVELEEYMVYLERGDAFNPEEYLSTFVVRGDDIDVSSGIPDGITCSITDRVNTHIPGVYQVKYVLSQNVNLVTFSGQAVLTVVVME